MKKVGFFVIVPSIVLMLLSFMLIVSPDIIAQYVGIDWLTIGLTLNVMKWEWLIREFSKSEE